MKHNSPFTKCLSCLFAAAYFFLPCFCDAKESSLELWYSQPAAQWTEALPIGNGSLGAMVFGGVEEECLQLNEDTLWGGGPYHPVNPQAKAALNTIRKLIFEGRYKEADELINTQMIANPRSQMPYQTAGNLRLKFSKADDDVSEYCRSLDLNTARASVSYVKEGVNYKREVFASNPDQVMVVNLSADHPGAISFVAGLDTPMNASIETEGEDSLILRGHGGDANGIKGVIDYTVRVKVIPAKGTLHAENGCIYVDQADSVTLLVAIATNYKRYNDVTGDPDAITRQRIQTADVKTYAELFERHVQDYQHLFHRVSLDLGTSESTQIPTDVRIKEFSKGNDPQLAALYYQFGRYLLISSSRKGSQPANLQGIWNNSVNPPWQSKYTVNINTEMNYWIAESGNLGECVEPLISLVEDLSETGAGTAREMYGARGWVVHHNTDLWRASAPIDGPFWGMWPTGGAWLCLHLWDRYLFSKDQDVLLRIYPTLKGACEFFLDTLQADPKTGWLVTNPSISPENGHLMGTSVCAGPTMDMQILRDLFTNTIEASELLGVDEDFRTALASAKAHLAPNRIGHAGQLQEWMEDWDMQAPEMNHRHVSHLYGLFPGNDISAARTPDLAAAARKSLEIRGDKATGWATAWRICLWAHLLDGNHAYQIFEFLLSPERTYPNMFDAHPPFQIDGNLGGAAGIVEMLLQSDSDNIYLLPALPNAWPEGSVEGVCARGSFEVNICWKDGKMTSADITALQEGTVDIHYGGTSRTVTFKKGECYHW
ncbi:MAG: glycoside hydrolase family 95 protein [Opitutales bacterium]|nr:glycoside hydrolase family 95 protein [Opitutales bacterium]